MTCTTMVTIRSPHLPGLANLASKLRKHLDMRNKNSVILFLPSLPHIETQRRHHKPVAGGLRTKGVSTITGQAIVRGLAHQHAVTVSKRRFSVGVVPRHRVRQFKFGARRRALSWEHLTARRNVFGIRHMDQGRGQARKVKFKGSQQSYHIIPYLHFASAWPIVHHNADIHAGG